MTEPTMKAKLLSDIMDAEMVDEGNSVVSIYGISPPYWLDELADKLITYGWKKS